MKLLHSPHSFATLVLFGVLFSGQALAAASVQGQVLEVKSTDSYSYLRLKLGAQETWAAVGLSNVKVGSTVTIENTMEMKNFESKALNKTFPSILFGTLREDGATAGNVPADAAHKGGKDSITLDLKVSKAKGPQGQTVADVVSKAAALSNKVVEVHAKVVKVNTGIMGKNWVHLRDGSGNSEDGSNDLLVTTTAEAKVGSVVTALGIVRTNKDFGGGYNYKVMLEDARLKP